MKNTVLQKIQSQYTLEKRDMGNLTQIRKGIYRFDNEAYTIKDTGNLFIMEMKALFGLMKMETIVITPLQKDLSFCNFDIVNAMGRETYIFEMYESSLADTDLSAFEKIKEKYAYLTSYPTEPRWYDEVRLPSSISKTGKKISSDADRMSEECLDTYLELLKSAPDCNPEEKKTAVRKYVDRLISEGGMAVDSMNKIIGPEDTAMLIRDFMYHV